MFKWEKLGKVFDPLDRKSENWMQQFAQSPSALIFDHYVRVYFCTRPEPTPDGQYLSYLSYVDLDRKNLQNIVNICQEPILSLGGFGAFDEFGTNPISVIRDGKMVRVYYAGWTRCESVPFNGAIGMAVSSDNGNSFERLGPGPVLSYSPDEPFLLGSPRIRKFGGTWYLWYVAGKEWLKVDSKAEPVYKIRMATSDDGITWTKLGRDLIENKLGEHECQACADVLFHQGKYHMFYSYRSIQNYKSKEGGYRIGYASSTDMIGWSRNDALAGMDVSTEGWDSEMVNYPHVFMLDGEIYMLYQGNEMGRTGFGLAKLDTKQDWSKI
jgi:predicted GH43/DUF377 family glycosyl hydrolase